MIIENSQTFLISRGPKTGTPIFRKVSMGALFYAVFQGGHIIGKMQNVYLNGAQIPEKKNIELPKYRMPEGNPDAADESLMPEG